MMAFNDIISPKVNVSEISLFMYYIYLHFSFCYFFSGISTNNCFLIVASHLNNILGFTVGIEMGS